MLKHGFILSNGSIYIIIIVRNCFFYPIHRCNIFCISIQTFYIYRQKRIRSHITIFCIIKTYRTYPFYRFYNRNDFFCLLISYIS